MSEDGQDARSLIAGLLGLADLGRACATAAGLREARACLVEAARLSAHLPNPEPAPASMSDLYAPLSAEAWQAEFAHLAR